MSVSPSEQRNPIESIATKFAESIRSGRQEAIDPVVTDNPDMETELRELLPVIQKLERARQAHAERPAGLATLGSERPDHLGDFQLVRQIGRGGMGVVFEAMQTSLGRKVAVKVLPKSLLSDEHQLKRFEQEARTAGSLHHTNIVPVFGVGEDQGFHYFVMQRIHGHGLDRLLSEGESKLSPKQVASLGYQAASALAYAHQQNVTHRDIKPANLIVNDQLQLWITDFGVAKAIESEAVTRTGDVVGTLRYMAPEQIVGDADFRSDIYSLGVTLYELLAGRPAMDDASIRRALVSRQPAPHPPPLRQLNPEVPRDLSTILHTAMSIDVGGRYQSAQALADDLDHFLREEPISVRPLSTLQLADRWARRNPAVASLTSLFVVLLFGFAVISTFGYVHVQRALDREQATRQNAEATAELASGALNQIFDRFTGRSDRFAESSHAFTSTPALSDEAAQLLEELLPYYDALAARSSFDPKFQQSAAQARYAMGDIHFSLGNYDRAIEAFKLALAGLTANGDTEVGSSKLETARIHNRLGMAYRFSGNSDQAESEHHRALSILDAEHQRGTATADQQFELARSHFLLTTQLLPGMGPTAMPPLDALQVRGSHGPGDRPHSQVRIPNQFRLEEADKTNLKTAINLLHQLRRDFPENIGYAVALASAMHRLDSDARRSGRNGRTANQGESIAILRPLYEMNPANETIRYEMSSMLADINVFGPRLPWPELEPSIDQLTEALTHFETLASVHPNVPKYTNAVAHTHFKLGVLLTRLAAFARDGKHRELEQRAGLSFREAAGRYADLLRRHDAAGYRAWHALFLMQQAESAFRSGLLEQAEQALLHSIEQWKWLTEHFPEEDIGWQALPDAYEMLAGTQQRLGNYEQARESMLESDMSRLYLDDGL